MGRKKIFIVTALTVDEDVGLEWQLEVQAHNLKGFLQQSTPQHIPQHIALYICKRGSVDLSDDKSRLFGSKCTMKRYVEVDNAEWEQVQKYKPIAKLLGLRAAIQIFAKSYFLYVDPDVVFTYNPLRRLSSLTETGMSFASNCTSYLRAASLPSHVANRVFGTSVDVQQSFLLGGAQYLLAPGSISTAEVNDMIESALEIFNGSDGKVWIAEMLAWHACLPANRIQVHKLLDFKLAHAPFSLTKLAENEEAIMIHLAGNFTKHPSLLNKHEYRAGKSPFDDLPAITLKCAGAPMYASWFYVAQLLGAAAERL